MPRMERTRSRMERTRTTPQASDGDSLITANGTAHNKQDDANRESLQQASHSSELFEPTNPCESEEIVANRKHNNESIEKENTNKLCKKNGPLSDATNALETRGNKTINKRHERLASEKKNANDGHTLNRDLLQQRELSVPDLPINGKATRSSYPSNESVTTDEVISCTRVRLPKQCRPGTERATLRLSATCLKEVRVRPTGASTNAFDILREELVLAQSQHDFGFELQVRSSHQNQKSRPHEIHMELNCDPGSDVILLCNIKGLGAREMINVKQLPVSSGSISSYLWNLEQFALHVSSYGIYISNEHIFDITILRRSYFLFTTEFRSQLKGTLKRALEPSSTQQDSTVNKRTKLKETSEGSSPSAIIQIAPTHPLTDEPIAVNSLSNVSEYNKSVVSDLRHPLEELQLNETVKVFSANKEEDYELTRRADLSVQPNSLVYEASCSKIPELVVKIWRSTLDCDTDSASVLRVSSIGRYWLNEVKALSEIGRHHAIVGFLGADARLLSIYLEKIHAPNLQSYRKRGRNAYCKLDYSDARRVLYNIADALSFVHRQGFSHDDVKPANILYSKARGPVLIDFGWSSRCSPEKAAHCAGSPWYIPPEYRQSGKRGPPGDVFALGIVMLFLLGQIPLPESQTPRLNWQISHLGRDDENADKALSTMNKWLKKVQSATCNLDQSPDLVSDKHVRDMVFLIPDMLKFRPKERITADALFYNLRQLSNPAYTNINLMQD